MDVEDLKRIGFVEIGEWRLDTEDRIALCLASEIGAKLTLVPNACYAFTEKTEVLYIGKTTQGIRKRFYYYANPRSNQSTNVRCNRNILEAIAADKVIGVLGFVPTTDLRIGEFRLNLAAGLEDDLIARFSPSWNGRDRGRVVTETAEIESEDFGTAGETQESDPAPAEAVFTVTLTDWYRKNGVINVPTVASVHLGAHGDPVTIDFEDGSPSVGAFINRVSNPNGSARIRCVGLRDWFVANCEPDDQLSCVIRAQKRIVVSKLVR
ncbi:GIY-YIG nuclease family protein [Paracoccus sediminis]|uniref:GIY-YIG nuclease family protein n=1 Tax=Paracoccus sediminis TaxID=1214787 RepID=A0A238YA13_9RHOB|nr:GIY-YIG nuclease family protein [Paracoccus sediminis]TBN46972.1 GIY-YIG nuclease family protein [Paracoccus sediminis]SNR67987.1 hypothetical protein SAMN06265378_11639 [Paracoccus sediminis]